MRPRRFLLAPFLTALALLPAACGGGGEATSTSADGGSTSASSGAGGTGGAGTGGASSSSSTGGSGGDKSVNCASTFGDALTAGHGRIDGTVLAVVKPSDTHCALPNDDHVVLQVVMNGEAYRMVINVESSLQVADPRVYFHELTHALPDPPWSEGWHLDVQFDYAKTLDAHSGSFTPHELAELSDLIAARITLGAPVSVYAETSGGASAHKIHRNSAAYSDGAVVLDPTSATPTFLLFRFSDQTF
jgi:hypothetical protein